MKALQIADMRQLDQAAAIAGANGLGLETQVLIHADLMAEDGWLDKHRAVLAELSPRSLHALFMDIRPGDVDPDIRQVARDRHFYACDMARKLGVDNIVFHAGYLPDSGDLDEWQLRATEFWQGFFAEAPADLHYHLENTFEPGPKALLELIDAINLPNVDVNLDVGHTHCFSSTPALEWIDVLGERIGYGHLHNNDGRGDQHRALGDGDIDLLAVCHALNRRAPQAIWTVEVDASAFAQSVKWLGKHGFL